MPMVSKPQQIISKFEDAKFLEKYTVPVLMLEAVYSVAGGHFETI